MAMSGLMRVMEKAARKAGNRLRRDFGEVEHLQVSRKGPADFVSKADQHAERTLWDELRAARPGWGFLMEEGGEIPGEEGKPRFIIDPLDGTSNFLHGIPHFAISIAVQEPRLDGKGWGEVTAALVYQPVTDESFWAEKTRGSWLQDRRLRVSSRRHLDESLIATGIPFAGRGALPATLQDLARLMPACAGVRRWGAAALDLAYVAAGRYDGYWERGIQPWDMAAGIILVREAGGFVSGIREGDDPVEKGSIIAGNSALFEDFRKVIRGE